MILAAVEVPSALCASVAGGSAVLPLFIGLGLSSLDFKEALPELLGEDVDELSPTGNCSLDRNMADGVGPLLPAVLSRSLHDRCQAREVIANLG